MRITVTYEAFNSKNQNNPVQRCQAQAASSRPAFASIFRLFDLVTWGVGVYLFSGCGRAWLPGCRVGRAAFCGPSAAGSAAWCPWRQRCA